MTELDLRGLRCPLPALHTARRLSSLAPGERLTVLADDPLATIDIAHLCHQDGHTLAETVETTGAWRFVIVAG